MTIDPSAFMNAYSGMAKMQGQMQEQNLANQQRQAELQMQPMKMQLAQQQMQSGNLDIAMKKIQTTLQLLGGVSDQTTYDNAKRQAQGMGLDVSGLPQMYDPKVIQQLGMSAMSAKDKLAQAMDERQQNETERHNKVVEGQYADGLHGRSTVPSSIQEYEYGQKNPDFVASQAQKKLKPMPSSAVKLQSEFIDDLRTAETIKADLGAAVQMIDSGKVQLGPMENMMSQGKNWMGKSDENSRNYTSLRGTLERMRNDSLRLNKGVQTEGDAVRAWNELFQNMNDGQVVKQRLGEIQQINDRAANLKQVQIDTLRQNFGNDPLDTDELRNPKPAIGGSGLNAQEQSRLQELRKKYGR